MTESNCRTRFGYDSLYAYSGWTASNLMTSYSSGRFCVILCTDGLSCSFITLYPWLPIVLAMSAVACEHVTISMSPSPQLRVTLRFALDFRKKYETCTRVPHFSPAYSIMRGIRTVSVTYFSTSVVTQNYPDYFTL